MAECSDETFFEVEDRANDHNGTGRKCPDLATPPLKKLFPSLPLTSALIRITNKASEKVQELKFGSGFAVVLEDKKVVLKKEGMAEAGQQTPTEPGTMLQLPHDTLVDVSIPDKDGNIHLTSDLMKKPPVEVHCVLELASKASAWGFRLEILRFMKYCDAKKSRQTTYTMDCLGESEFQTVPETPVQDTNDSNFGQYEKVHRAVPAEPEMPGPDPMTDERKAKINRLLADGYVDGATCVTDKHRSHDVWATLLVNLEKREAVCNRCFKGFLMDTRTDFGPDSSITKHFETLCGTIQSDHVPGSPLRTPFNLLSHLEPVSSTMNTPAKPAAGIGEDEMKLRLAKNESIAVDVFNAFSHLSRKTFQKSLNDYVRRRKEHGVNSSDTTSLAPLERNNRRVLPLPSQVANLVNELRKTHRNEIEEYKKFLLQTNMFKSR